MRIGAEEVSGVVIQGNRKMYAGNCGRFIYFKRNKWFQVNGINFLSYGAIPS